MRTAAFASLMAAVFVLAGCSTPTPTSYPPPPKETASVPSGVKPPAPKLGRIGHGIIATHYDRDGDGRFEEARRAQTIYYDRNGDRVADLVLIGEPPATRLEWDVDFDGTLDRTVTSFEGYVHEWGDRRDISRPAPQVFKKDRIGRVTSCDLSEPKYRFWELMLKLKPS